MNHSKPFEIDLNLNIPKGELSYEDGVLKYFSANPDYAPVYFDFMKYYRHHMNNRYSIKKEPLAKALGLKGDKVTSVLDATFGTGKDSFLMLAFGAQVTAFERDPLVSRLAMDAFNRLSKELENSQDLFSKIEFFEGDAKASPSEFEFDVIYLDPMYPDNKKRSLPRKEMALFRDILIEDDDSEALFSWAMERAKKRVVVKRSLKDKPITPHVTASYLGKTTRYDMYSCF